MFLILMLAAMTTAIPVQNVLNKCCAPGDRLLNVTCQPNVNNVAVNFKFIDSNENYSIMTRQCQRILRVVNIEGGVDRLIYKNGAVQLDGNTLPNYCIDTDIDGNLVILLCGDGDDNENSNNNNEVTITITTSDTTTDVDADTKLYVLLMILITIQFFVILALLFQFD